MDALLLKLHAVQFEWQNHRLIIVPAHVVHKFQVSNIGDDDIGLRNYKDDVATPSSVVIKRLRQALEWEKTAQKYIESISSCFPGLGVTKFFCIDKVNGFIDKSVPIKGPYVHDWSSRTAFPPRSDVFNDEKIQYWQSTKWRESRYWNENASRVCRQDNVRRADRIASPYVAKKAKPSRDENDLDSKAQSIVSFLTSRSRNAHDDPL